MLHSGKINSHTEIERCKFSQEQRKTTIREREFPHIIGCFNILRNIRQENLPHRGKGKINFPTYRVLSPTNHRSTGKINSHTYT
jgi:hypothetical protein